MSSTGYVEPDKVLEVREPEVGVHRLRAVLLAAEQRAGEGHRASVALGGGTEFLRRQVVKTVTNSLRRQRADRRDRGRPRRRP